MPDTRHFWSQLLFGVSRCLLGKAGRHHPSPLGCWKTTHLRVDGAYVSRVYPQGWRIRSKYVFHVEIPPILATPPPPPVLKRILAGGGGGGSADSRKRYDWTISITIFEKHITVHEFAFHISTKTHEISENYVVEGGRNGSKFSGTTLFKTQNCEVVHLV